MESIECKLIWCWVSFQQYLQKGSLHDPQLDDLKDFRLTNSAMDHMGMKESEKDDIYAVVAGVLHLGNVSFEENIDDSKGMDFLLQVKYKCFLIFPYLYGGTWRCSKLSLS